MSLLDRLVTPQDPAASQSLQSLHNIVPTLTHHRVLHGDSHVVFAGDDFDADGAHAVHLEPELTRSRDD